MSKRLSIEVSDNLHKNLKIAAAKEGCSLKDFITHLIDEKIEFDNKNNSN